MTMFCNVNIYNHCTLKLKLTKVAPIAKLRRNGASELVIIQFNAGWKCISIRIRLGSQQ